MLAFSARTHLKAPDTHRVHAHGQRPSVSLFDMGVARVC